jgi:hypothetical protein
MKISDLIIHLNNLRKEHGDVDVIGVAPEYEVYKVEKDKVNFLEADGNYVRHTAVYIGPD